MDHSPGWLLEGAPYILVTQAFIRYTGRMLKVQTHHMEGNLLSNLSGEISVGVK